MGGPIDYDNVCMGQETCQPMYDAAGCQIPCPRFCGPEEFVCPGGMDFLGCRLPDTCIKSKGPMDFNGVECPALCPTVCAVWTDVICPGGMTDTGCMIADTCHPEGTECPMPPMPM